MTAKPNATAILAHPEKKVLARVVTYHRLLKTPSAQGHPELHDDLINHGADPEELKVYAAATVTASVCHIQFGNIHADTAKALLAAAIWDTQSDLPGVLVVPNDTIRCV